MKTDFLVDNVQLHAMMGDYTMPGLSEAIFKVKRNSSNVHELRGYAAIAAVLIALGWPI